MIGAIDLGKWAYRVHIISISLAYHEEIITFFSGENGR